MIKSQHSPHVCQRLLVDALSSTVVWDPEGDDGQVTPSAALRTLRS